MHVLCPVYNRWTSFTGSDVNSNIVSFCMYNFPIVACILNYWFAMARYDRHDVSYGTVPLWGIRTQACSGPNGA